MVRDTTASIINVPGWSGSKWVRKDPYGLPGGLRDEFVIFTDRDGASDMNYMNLAYWIRYIPADAVPFEDIHLIYDNFRWQYAVVAGCWRSRQRERYVLGPCDGAVRKEGERGVSGVWGV